MWSQYKRDLKKREKEECIFLNNSYRITVQYFKIVVLLSLSIITTVLLAVQFVCKLCIFRILN